MVASSPPAQPTKTSPSSSVSRFKRISPFKKSGCNPKAPVIPVSSSTVINTSIGPCCKSLETIIAIPVATPMPLSAPKVVPEALSQPSSPITGIMGSVKKL